MKPSRLERSRITEFTRFITCFVVAASIVLAVGVAAPACSGTPKIRPPPPFTGIERGGVRLVRFEKTEAGRGAARRGRVGDWLLEAPPLTLVVGAGGKDVEGQAAFGALLDATAAGFVDDTLVEMRRVLEIDGREARVSVVSVEPTLDGDRPTLRVVERDEQARVELVTKIALVPAQSYVELSTDVKNTTRALLSVKLGDRMRWVREPPFAPRLGLVTTARRAHVEWLGLEARHQTYAVVAPSGLDVVFRIDVLGSREQVAWSNLHPLADGATLNARRMLVVVPGDLARAAEIAWPLFGAPVGWVEGRIDPVPPHARIAGLSSDGSTLLEINLAADGHFRLPLPGGVERLRLVTPGGSDEQPVRIEPGRTSAAPPLIAPSPRRVSYRVGAPDGTPLAARLVVRGVPPTPDPELGPVHLSAGAGNVTIADHGAGSIELPAGRYRILATHGVEWTVVESEVDVTAEQGKVVRFTLERAIDTTGYAACDLHLHANPSGDSDVPLRDRVLTLLAEGIEFAAATDHNHVTDYAPAVDQTRATLEIETARGVEITTSSWGHFNTYPLPAGAAAPPYANVDPTAIFAAVRAVAPSAIIQVNHPRMGDIGYFGVGGLYGAPEPGLRPGFSYDFDVIEVHNGFEHGDPNVVEQNLFDWFRLLDEGRHYTAVGNSDSHRVVLQWAGYPRTYVRTPEPGLPVAATVAAALHRGRALVTSGPYVELKVGGAEMGDVVKTKNGRVHVELVVSAAPWVDVTHARVFVNGRVAVDLPVEPPRSGVRTRAPGERLRWASDVPVDGDGWLLVIVTGTHSNEAVLPGWQLPPLAFTNPVFVDADGDGLVAPRPAPLRTASAPKLFP